MSGVALVCLGLAGALALGLGRLAPGLHPALAWWLAISLVAFAAFARDKALARRRGRRVPERVLLGLVALGGTLGGLAGMHLLRHKSAKRSFRLRFWGIVAAQLLVAGLWAWIRRGAT